MKSANIIVKLILPSIVLSFFLSFILVDLLKVKHVDATLVDLPAPTQLLESSKVLEMPVLKGIKLDPDNPLKIDFILDHGDQESIDPRASAKLVNYFLAALTVPQDNFWVNLSPYEKDRVVEERLGITDLGKDMLAQDYILKQMMSSLTYPERGVGKEYWTKINQEMLDDIKSFKRDLDTFNKVWILPGYVEVLEHETTAVVSSAELKVMMEEDYLAKMYANNNNSELDDKSSQLLKEIIIPVIEDEVNYGKHFAPLRQLYHSLILALWFKQKFAQSFYKNYIDQDKVAGIDIDDKKAKDKIFARYKEAFEKGVYDYIKKERMPGSREKISRRYFSGGENFSSAVLDIADSTRNIASKEEFRQALAEDVNYESSSIFSVALDNFTGLVKANVAKVVFPALVLMSLATNAFSQQEDIGSISRGVELSTKTGQSLGINKLSLDDVKSNSHKRSFSIHEYEKSFDEISADELFWIIDDATYLKGLMGESFTIDKARKTLDFSKKQARFIDSVSKHLESKGYPALNGMKVLFVEGLGNDEKTMSFAQFFEDYNLIAMSPYVLSESDPQNKILDVAVKVIHEFVHGLVDAPALVEEAVTFKATWEETAERSGVNSGISQAQEDVYQAFEYLIDNSNELLREFGYPATNPNEEFWNLNYQDIKVLDPGFIEINVYDMEGDSAGKNFVVDVNTGEVSLKEDLTSKSGENIHGEPNTKEIYDAYVNNTNLAESIDNIKKDMKQFPNSGIMFNLLARAYDEKKSQDGLVNKEIIKYWRLAELAEVFIQVSVTKSDEKGFPSQYKSVSKNYRLSEYIARAREISTRSDFDGKSSLELFDEMAAELSEQDYYNAGNDIVEQTEKFDQSEVQMSEQASLTKGEAFLNDTLSQLESEIKEDRNAEAERAIQQTIDRLKIELFSENPDKTVVQQCRDQLNEFMENSKRVIDNYSKISEYIHSPAADTWFKFIGQIYQIEDMMIFFGNDSTDDAEQNSSDSDKKSSAINTGGIDIADIKIDVKGETLPIAFMQSPFDMSSFSGFVFKILSLKKLETQEQLLAFLP